MATKEQVVIVVGAGPSGLATAACLNSLSIPNIVLEREDCFASLWKKYSYDRLHLHLAKQFCQLPLKPFPTTYPTYVSRDQFLRYLDDYVSHFNICPLYQRSVESAQYDEAAEAWIVKARNLGSSDPEEMEEYSSKCLVVATGETTDAFIPQLEGLNTYLGEVIHSTRYKNGKSYENKNVLVVGSGNSGMEIAFDLSNYGAKTSIAVRSPLHILSRGMANMGLVLLKYVSLNAVDSLLLMLSKLWYGGDLSRYGIKRPEEGPFTMKVKYGKYPVIDIGTYQKIKSGEIQVVPAVASLGGNDVVFEDGKSYPFDAIIFATGFKRSTNKWLQGADYLLSDDGLAKPAFPNNWKGTKGLYCAGLARRGLYGAALDAQSIANDIKRALQM
ncbi:probable indole-3-pyruvate monooxygenase YUCCA10 [Coffea eugenioides]|uniref:probable indole-3-pyruvate monooxygenase YUCCA10 n=1 Tax=Coffea eugenioides TaxID=49369 RepID=UPI000F614F3E|nr:probable indole-3-pyruvate monooxygenase YUCCA10 [Coffea eugenioides]